MNIESHITEIIKAIGEDPDREGLIKTPSRVSKAYEFLLGGYKQSMDEVINDAVFNETANGMVIVRDVEFYSLCEHHMLPFYGRCHVAYIPNNKIIGVSKIPRLVDMFARRLQVQERLTDQIAETLMELLEPQGVGVVMSGKHLCMMMRGVEKQNSVMTTSAVRGVFEKNLSTRDEFLKLIPI